MKTKIIELYTAQELRDKFPESFERALKRHAEDVGRFDADIWGSEIWGSIKGACRAAGVEIKDYSLGAYSPSSISVRFPHKYDGYGDPGDLSGPRAMTWLENNLFGPCRITPKKAAEYRSERYGKYYRAGRIKPCPFTGICYDDDIIERLARCIKDGDTLREAFEGLADYYRKQLESEIEANSTAEAFIEHAAVNDMEFREDGEIER